MPDNFNLVIKMFYLENCLKEMTFLSLIKNFNFIYIELERENV